MHSDKALYYDCAKLSL